MEGVVDWARSSSLCLAPWVEHLVFQEKWLVDRGNQHICGELFDSLGTGRDGHNSSLSVSESLELATHKVDHLKSKYE